MNDDSGRGLDGLSSIRDAVSLTLKQVAHEAKVSVTYLHQLEQKQRNCSFDMLDRLAEALCCTRFDLLGAPTSQRLNEIKAAFHQREADRAREEAKAAS